jgi:hypothetical protein
MLYTCIKWSGFVVGIVLTCASALFYAICPMQVWYDPINHHIIEKIDPNYTPEHIPTFQKVCLDNEGNLYGWALNLPTWSSTKLQDYTINRYNGTENINQTYVHYDQYYKVDMVNLENGTFDKEILENMKSGNMTWFSTYADDIPATLIYLATTIFSTAGLGDVPLELPIERAIGIFFIFMTIVVTQTKFLSVLSDMVACQISEKTDLVMCAYTTFFISNADHYHRIEKTQTKRRRSCTTYSALLFCGEH